MLLVTMWVFLSRLRYISDFCSTTTLMLACGENMLIQVVNIRSEMCISFKPAALRGGGNVAISLLHYALFSSFVQLIPPSLYRRYKHDVKQKRSYQQVSPNHLKISLTTDINNNMMFLRHSEFTRPFTPASFSLKTFRLNFHVFRPVDEFLILSHTTTH
jgi:hypothetical protein